MGVFLDIFVEYLFRAAVRAIRVLRSRAWPFVQATVLSAECPRAGYGCTVATVYYEYIVEGQKYGAAFKKPFIVRGSGERFAGEFVKGADLPTAGRFMVRVSPGNLSVTVPYW